MILAPYAKYTAMNTTLALQIIGMLLNRVTVSPAEQFAAQAAMDFLAKREGTDKPQAECGDK